MERTPGTHCTGGYVGPRTAQDTEATGKIFCLSQGSNLDLPVIQPVARHYTDRGTPAPFIPVADITVVFTASSSNISTAYDKVA
jgi:hypothetical protein